MKNMHVLEVQIIFSLHKQDIDREDLYISKNLCFWQAFTRLYVMPRNTGNLSCFFLSFSKKLKCIFSKEQDCDYHLFFRFGR